MAVADASDHALYWGGKVAVIAHPQLPSHAQLTQQQSQLPYLLVRSFWQKHVCVYLLIFMQFFEDAWPSHSPIPFSIIFGHFKQLSSFTGTLRAPFPPFTFSQNTFLIICFHEHFPNCELMKDTYSLWLYTLMPLYAIVVVVLGHCSDWAFLSPMC